MNLFLDYASLGILFAVLLILIYGLIIVHDIPYEMALKRDHPHADAIHVAGWVSLFFLHVLWPFLWIWATMYNGEKKEWLGERKSVSSEDYSSLVARLDELEKNSKG
ncbi:MULTISPECIES: DUF3302 domain-containing protein [Aliivibrio]|uniref:GTPase n=1 Tax=Aliivibrio logei 5S-186 TaxID=626086 RepID=A0ABX3ATM3_ALILO|nr:MULTISPECIES: DUF3302 domain-containing protein [Aliivibrio]MBB1312119.1 DUF3302 domain-containing protein [Aliivibrio sp. SR45-2]OEF09798.1 hypothetical protein A1Q5_14435 [Aliivibrio logei 5S-186]